MGIDIYARWKNQTVAEIKAQYTGFDATMGHVGYLREAYHGEPYVTQFFVAEAFNRDRDDYSPDLGVPIPAALLRARLPRAIELAIERENKIYGQIVTEDDPIVRSFAGFVELCEEKERQTGEPCHILASW